MKDKTKELFLEVNSKKNAFNCIMLMISYQKSVSV